VLTFTDDNFDQDVLGSSEPVLVDFGAEWCPPCNAMAPTVEVIASEYAGRAKVGAFDIDSGAARAAALGVTTLPTFIVFRNGQVMKKLVGTQGRKDLAAAIDDALG